MEYSSMGRAHRLPGIVRSRTDDEDHSVFDFPYGDERSDDQDRKHGKKKRPKNKGKKGGHEPPPAAAHHPYPASISITVDGTPPSNKKSPKQHGSEFRSPVTSPARGHKYEDPEEDLRQPHSPASPPGRIGSNGIVQGGDTSDQSGSELAKHHRAGQNNFNCNRLSEAVDSYSVAIRAGLDELTQRKETLARMGSKGNSQQDEVQRNIGHTLAQVHIDMGATLEVAQKYPEAKLEWENGVGMLTKTCGVDQSDARVRQLKKDVKRMDQAIGVERERKRHTEAMGRALRALKAATDKAREDARRGAVSGIKKLLRLERESLGEQSYAVAKLRLKLAKAQCEGGDVEGGLKEADAALVTLKRVLGKHHTLVGAACLFAGAVYERRTTTMLEKDKDTAAILGEDGNEDGGSDVEASPQCKILANKALEYYGDALEPLRFKHDHVHDATVEHSTLRPDMGDVFCKMAALHSRTGSHSSAVDAYHRALEAYGATGVDRSDVSKKKNASFRDVHPDAVVVWHDLAVLHLKKTEYSDAVYASEKSVELAKQVRQSSFHSISFDERMEDMPIKAHQTAGDAYEGMGRHDDATRSYLEAHKTFQRMASRGSKNQGAPGPVDEAKILRRLGVSLSHQGRLEEAKACLMDALRMLRSSKDADASASDMRSLLVDIGRVHLRCGEWTEATNALRLCLKMYAERGISDRHARVEEASKLLEEAQHGPSMGSKPKTVSMSPSSKLMAGTHLSTGMAMVETPCSAATMSTVPSSIGYSRASSAGNASSRSGHGQLQTLLEELASPEPKDNSKSMLSPKHKGHPLPKPPLALDANEMHRLKTRLEETEKTAHQYQLRVKEVEAERDQARKEKVMAAAAHRKEVEAITQTNMKGAFAESEAEALRKELSVTEASYRELVRAIDDEKEKIGSTHESEVRGLRDEIRKLKDELKCAGGIENNRLSEALSAKEREAEALRAQGQRLSQEVAALKSTNMALQSKKGEATREAARLRSENDKLQADLRRVSSELLESKSKIEMASRVPVHNVELKNLEWELQQERSRRMILESSLEKEYDRGNNGGGMAYPMPFGYPMAPPMMGQNNNTAKLKTLEIDLATERASKEMLQNVVQELRRSHDQEKASMQDQYSAFVASHQQDTSQLLAEVGAKEAEIDRISQELDAVKDSAELLSREMDDTLHELSDVKEQLMQTASELSTEMEDKQKTSEALDKTMAELKSAKTKLDRKESDNAYLTNELKSTNESLRRKESERDYLSDENGRLKKEYHEAITVFESEIDRIKAEKDELSNENERSQNELTTAKLHLKSVLSELEGAHQSIGSLENDAQHLRVTVENAREDACKKGEELEQARQEIEELSEIYQELEGKLSELEGVVSLEKQARKDKEEILGETKDKLCAAEKTIEELRESISQLDEVDGQRKKLVQTLRSISKKLENILPTEVDVPESPEDEEALESRIAEMLAKIADYCKQQRAAIKSKESTLEKTEWNLSQAAHDLDKLEMKHKTLREELAEMGDLQGEYDKLVEEYEIAVEEREGLEESLKADYLEKEAKATESLQKAQEERDLFESRLKEAVDDLEELECERDSIRAELEKAQDEFAKRESSLSSMITALETDNKLIAELEGQALEYDAALSEKDAKLKKLEQELLSARSGNTEADSALMEKDEKLKSAENELRKARAEIDKIQSEIAEMKINKQSIEESGELEQLLPAERGCDIYPDLLPGTNICSGSALEEQNGESQSCTSTNPFDATNPFGPHDSKLEDEDGMERSIQASGSDLGAERTTTNPFDEESLGHNEVSELKARLAELEIENETLRMQLEQVPPNTDTDEIAMSREIEARIEETADLKDYIQALEENNRAMGSELAECREEINVAATVHNNDCEAISSLQQELESWKDQTAELQACNATLEGELQGYQSSMFCTEIKEDLASNCSVAEVDSGDMFSNEIASLKDQLETLREQNAQMTSQLSEGSQVRSPASSCVNPSEQGALAEQIVSLKSRIQTLEADNKALSMKLAQSEAYATEVQADLDDWRSRATNAEKAHESDQTAIMSLQNELNEKEDAQKGLREQERLYKVDLGTWKSRAAKAENAHKHDQATITTLQSALNEKESILQEKMQQEELHKNDEGTWKSQVVELKQTNAALQRAVSELSAQTSLPEDHTECNEKLSSLQMDLDERKIQHSLELATVNAELHNAMMSLDELQKENQNLKGEIESLASIKNSEETDESKNFEKEMNAAHSRFVSMEKALQDRVSRLEREKDKLIADFNTEMINKEDEHSQTKIELSAWKLEMQNALNDIEALKKERDSLKAQVQSYATSLEAVCVGKAELEEKVHSLGTRV